MCNMFFGLQMKINRFSLQMEQIKRTNRLHTTDTIFLRQYLMIPVPLDSPVNSGGGSSSDVRRSHSLDVQYYDSPLFPSNDTSTGSSTITASSSMTSCKSSEQSVPEPDPDEDIENFLSKVDSSIAVTKKSVEQTRKQSDILAKIHETTDCEQREDDNSTCFNNPSYDGNCNTNGAAGGGGTTYAGTRRKYEGAYQNLTEDHSVGSRRNSSRRHIKNSIHRLEKQQDELFEL